MKKHFFKVFMLSLGLTGATSMFAASYMDTAAINLNLRNVTIEQAFKAIEEQSEFSFFYNEEEVSSDQRISIHVKDKGITEVLNQFTTVQRNYPIGSVDLNRNHSSDVLV